MKKRPEESVHVRLDLPIEKRRAVLQAAIDIMQLMKRYEGLVRISQEKEQEYAEFRKILSSINRMVKEVRVKELPLDTEDMKHVKKVKNQSVMRPVVRKVENILSKKHEERKPALDRQIEELQRKLQSI